MATIEVDKRAIALERAKELKERIVPYLEAREKVESGLDLSAQFEQRKEDLKRFF
ncbi:MAG: lysine 2,3-aminomutase, partial [Firmicutes bacterium]|nr:lysine 2,3-aminomutase [Bacillota bacterium]